MKTRRITVLAAGIALTLAACGTSDSATSPASDPAPEVDATPDDAAPDDAAADDAAADDTTAPAEPAEEPEQPDTVATEPPTEETPETDVAPTVAPTDGESGPPDTEPAPDEVAAAPVGGRALATDVASESQFDGNPFPDLVVADVGRSGEANLANLLPSDRPLLLWAWAPH